MTVYLLISSKPEPTSDTGKGSVITNEVGEEVSHSIRLREMPAGQPQDIDLGRKRNRVVDCYAAIRQLS